MLNKKAAIIGGGITGLTLAYRLAQKGFKVKLFESLDKVGGLARAIEINASPIEIFYHHFFQSDGCFLKICQELGIGSRIKWLKAKMGYLSGGRIFDFGTPDSLLRFKPFSLKDKVSFTRLILKIKNEKSLEELDGCSAQDWLIKNAGQRVFDVIWKPLLIQKFGDFYKEVPMAWLWKKMQVRSLNNRNIFSEGRLGYLEGSTGVLIDKLSERIIQFGAEIAVAEKVEKIELVDGGYKLKTPGPIENFEIVISTVAPQVLGNLLNFPDNFNERLKGFKQLGVICVLMVLKKKLTDYYWLNIGDNSFPFGLVVEHTNFCQPQDFDGRHLVYISKYVDAADELYSSCSDNELVDYFLKHLSRINSDFCRDWIEKILVFREPFAQPLISKNYLTLKPDYNTPLPNFYWLSANHIYPDDRGINQAIKIAEELAGFIFENHN